MKKLLKATESFLVKHGTMIASCAFAFVLVAANSMCTFPFYEPEEPEGLTSFKKFS